MLGDRLEQHGDRVVADPCGEQIGSAVARERSVLERQPEVLGEARLTGAEEAGHPDADALVRLVRRLRVALEDRAEVGADGVGGDVLGELLADELLVGLVDLDDLFDVPLDVGGEEVFDDALRSCRLVSRRSSVGSCARRRDAHEAEAGGAVELARIEEDGRDVHLALQLLEQRRGSIDGEERSGPDDEDDVAERIGVAGNPLRRRGRRAARTR